MTAQRTTMVHVEVPTEAIQEAVARAVAQHAGALVERVELRVWDLLNDLQHYAAEGEQPAGYVAHAHALSTAVEALFTELKAQPPL